MVYIKRWFGLKLYIAANINAILGMTVALFLLNFAFIVIIHGVDNVDSLDPDKTFEIGILRNI